MPTIIVQPIVNVELSADEAVLFRDFQKNYGLISPLLHYLDSLKIADIRSTSIVFDVDNQGKVSHVAVTKHTRY